MKRKTPPKQEKEMKWNCMECGAIMDEAKVLCESCSWKGRHPKQEKYNGIVLKTLIDYKINNLLTTEQAHDIIKELFSATRDAEVEEIVDRWYHNLFVLGDLALDRKHIERLKYDLLKSRNHRSKE